MAEESAKPAQAKRLPLKTLLILLGVFLAEGAAISAIFVLAGGPADVRAEDPAALEQLALEQEVEELVIAEKFQNAKTGRVYVYDLEVFVVVRRKHQEQVRELLDSRQATLRAELATIIRDAEPAYLEEPALATLSRQMQARLDEHLGADEQGHRRLLRVLIPKCIGFKANL